MDQSTFQLVYASRRAVDVTDEDIIDGIVLSAMRKNRVLEITGVLWFDEHNFVQVLEGNAERVSDLYREIERDDRHNRVTLLSAQHVEVRHFARFSMRHVRSTSRDAVFELAQLRDKADPRSLATRLADSEIELRPAPERRSILRRAVSLLELLTREFNGHPV